VDVKLYEQRCCDAAHAKRARRMAEKRERDGEPRAHLAVALLDLGHERTHRPPIPYTP